MSTTADVGLVLANQAIPVVSKLETDDARESFGLQRLLLHPLRHSSAFVTRIERQSEYLLSEAFGARQITPF